MKIIGSTTSNAVLLVEINREELANLVGEASNSDAEYKGIRFYVGTELKVSEMYKKIKQLELDFTRQLDIAKQLEAIAIRLKSQLDYVNPPPVVPGQSVVTDTQKRYDIDI